MLSKPWNAAIAMDTRRRGAVQNAEATRFEVSSPKGRGFLLRLPSAAAPGQVWWKIQRRSMPRVREERAFGDDLLGKLRRAVAEGNLGATLLQDIGRSTKKLQQVLAMLREQKQANLVYAALEAIREDGGMQLNQSNYAFGSSTCARASRWQQALQLFEAMPTAKIQPDVISYSVAISACEKGRAMAASIEVV
ncbi:unnamed protein product [Durusdinium trenchii]|uniref:Pentatricopeptide repeat-containing protein n=1 Tax=Durusdinium trenchii TaxID=1381693 RepID=A0ABP0M3R3_9DINO